jgi:hypothetical protein
LEENGVWGIELQDGFELFGAKVLDPGFAILVRAASVEGCGTAVAVGERIGATMVAKATNAMPARHKEENSSELAGGVEQAFIAALLN